ncbi:uncharacterized protein LOC131668856 isoform X2 [Phymastichus coffea]|uniref:uncharacterized protein LOC131668856 isoform X2 n=1 Tax=Phymastichus coffea TaxID=108790 RepID=UPI00273BAE15|nr:uncharacterized protein LOC131668856 isoform X2 [Phymastichus coffea]
MAANALEEKINKIKQQNEQIRKRYKEVEADKKNAAKLNALVQLVPSDDWPERREPPEFSAPPKTVQKQKSVTKDRENERSTQYYTGIQERLAKKEHKFAQGEGPPPDPKYNFLADSERETRTVENRTDEDKNKSRNRASRGGAGPRRRGGNNADNQGLQAFHNREESLPEYKAWRAERNRIDEARINRQKTAEGNWRREWDCNKVSLEKDQPKRDYTHKDLFDRRNNRYDNDYSTRGHGGSRTYHQSQKNYSQDYRHPYHEQLHEFKKQQSDCKTPLSPVDNRTVAAFDQSIKVTVNQGSQANKSTVMSVKVNSPSIAGTGRVGPRQKSRITYSSQSDSNTMASESNSFMKQKSFDEKAATANFNNGPKLAPKSPFAQRKKEGNLKSSHFFKKEFRNDLSPRPKSQSQALLSQRNESRDQRQSNNFFSKSQRIQKRKFESIKTGNVSVVEDFMPVENDINKPIDNQFHIQNNDIIERETNNIDFLIIQDTTNNTRFSDLLNNFSHSVADDNEIKVRIEEKAVEESNKNNENDNNIKTYQKSESTQKSEIFDVYLVDRSIEKIVNSSSDFVNRSIADHQEIVTTSYESSSTADSKSDILGAVEVKSNLNTTKEILETTVDMNNKKEDIDLKPEEEKNVMLEQSEKKITFKQNETDDATNEESQQSNSAELKVDNSKVEDNSVIDLVEPEENAQIHDSIPKDSDDSGFLDNAEIDFFNKTSISEINDSALLSDCNVIEDLDGSFKKSVVETEKDKIFQEPTKSDFVSIIKCDCKETVDICDNVSVASSDIQVIESKEKSNEISAISITDNNDKVIENDQENLEASRMINMKEENINTMEKKAEQLSEESTELKSEESKNV